MEDLVEFLTARYDEERQVAVVADALTRSPWKSDGCAVECGDGFDVAVASDGESATAAHIACWDPARVLADIAAKRAILDLHAPEPSRYIAGRWVGGQQGELQCSHCGWLCHSETGLNCDTPDAPYPCDTVRLLVQPYATHPDFREEWRVAP